MSDREKAAQYRAKVTACLSSLCKLIDEAKKEGLIINYGTADDAEGRQVVTKVEILQKL